MARIEIDERAWSDPRFKRLYLSARITPAYAIGILAVLWHDSQAEGKIVATETDLRVWFANERRFSNTIINALFSSGYLLRKDDCFDGSETRYEISGNDERLAKIEFYKDRARKAIYSRWAKRDTPSNTSSNTSSIREAILESASSNTITVDNRHLDNRQQTENEEKKKKEQEQRKSASADLRRARAMIAPSVDSDDHSSGEDELAVSDASLENAAAAQAPATKRRKRPTIDANGKDEQSIGSRTSALIASFCESYSERFRGVRPEVSGKEAGCAKRLVQQIGLDRAIEIVKAYVDMNDWGDTHTLAHLSEARTLNAVKLHMSGQTIRTRPLFNRAKAINDGHQSVLDEMFGPNRPERKVN